MKKTYEQRFWEKVNKTKTCWLWTAYRQKGYGSFEKIASTNPGPAHRISYELLVGAIPKGMVLDHKCRNRACVNPSHLRIVTPRENVLENSKGFASKNKSKTRCVRGHKFTAENTYYRKDERSGRHCKKCHLIRNLAFKKKARDLARTTLEKVRMDK